MRWIAGTKKHSTVSQPDVEQAAPTPQHSRRGIFGVLRTAGLGIAAATGVMLFKDGSTTAYAKEQPGAFQSDVSTIPAVTAAGTNGAKGVQASSDTNIGVEGTTISGIGVAGTSSTAQGVDGQSQSGPGVHGQSESSSGVEGISTSSYGVGGQSFSHDTNISGVLGVGQFCSGVQGTSETGFGVAGTSLSGVGVRGDCTSGTAIVGQSQSGSGVEGMSTSGFGVSGTTVTGTGVFGEGNQGIDVHGHALGIGVLGESGNSFGVAGTSLNGIGVHGQSQSGLAGLFEGDVQVTGTLSKGGGSFLIDHPLDPANKSLSHSFVESPDMKNIYDGVVVFDSNGEAAVTLPAWFGALNADFRYQLTCLGGYAPVYVASKIEGNQFKIAGGKAGMEVSWQVTGIRQDA